MATMLPPFLERDLLPVRRRRARFPEVVHRPPCPKCKQPMALRMGREGPFFDCGCKKRQ